MNNPDRFSPEEMKSLQARAVSDLKYELCVKGMESRQCQPCHADACQAPVRETQGPHCLHQV